MITCKKCGQSDYSAIVRTMVVLHAHEYRSGGKSQRAVESSESPDLDFTQILALRCRTEDCENGKPGVENVKTEEWVLTEPDTWADDATAWRESQAPPKEPAPAQS